MRTTFTYDVDVRMVVPAWVDRTVATTVVGMSDHYDNLTRRHSLSRLVLRVFRELQPIAQVA